MPDPDKTMTVGQLRTALTTMPEDATVQVWLPGQYINLSGIVLTNTRILIEGNVAE
jgi:hypothetical protein